MAATVSCDLKSNGKKGILNFQHHSPVVMSWRRVDLTTCGRIPRSEDSLPELELTGNFGVTAHPKPSCFGDVIRVGSGVMTSVFISSCGSSRQRGHILDVSVAAVRPPEGHSLVQFCHLLVETGMTRTSTSCGRRPVSSD